MEQSPQSNSSPNQFLTCSNGCGRLAKTARRACCCRLARCLAREDVANRVGQLTVDLATRQAVNKRAMQSAPMTTHLDDNVDKRLHLILQRGAIVLWGGKHPEI
jgi:hypothetical protein